MPAIDWRSIVSEMCKTAEEAETRFGLMTLAAVGAAAGVGSVLILAVGLYELNRPLL